MLKKAQWMQYGQRSVFTTVHIYDTAAPRFGPHNTDRKTLCGKAFSVNAPFDLSGDMSGPICKRCKSSAAKQGVTDFSQLQQAK